MRTLLEHHYVFRLKVLEDDPYVDYLAKMRVVEKMACEMGWRSIVSLEVIENRCVKIEEA